MINPIPIPEEFTTFEMAECIRPKMFVTLHIIFFYVKLERLS